jgi:hypothetical protein
MTSIAMPTRLDSPMTSYKFCLGQKVEVIPLRPDRGRPSGIRGDRTIQPRRRSLLLREESPGTLRLSRDAPAVRLPSIDETSHGIASSHPAIPAESLGQQSGFLISLSNDTAEMLENRASNRMPASTPVDPACQCRSAWIMTFRLHVDPPAANALTPWSGKEGQY